MFWRVAAFFIFLVSLVGFFWKFQKSVTKIINKPLYIHFFSNRPYTSHFPGNIVIFWNTCKWIQRRIVKFSVTSVNLTEAVMLRCSIKPATYIEMMLRYKCFSVDFAKILRISVLQNTCERLVLSQVVWLKNSRKIDNFSLWTFYGLFSWYHC